MQQTLLESCTEYPAVQELVIFLGGWEENTIEALDVLPPTHVQEQGRSYTKLRIHMHANASIHPARLCEERHAGKLYRRIQPVTACNAGLKRYCRY